MTRLVALSVLNLIRNPLRQAVLYPWVIVTLERWAVQRWGLAWPASLYVDAGRVGTTLLGAFGLGAIALGTLLCLATMVQFVVDGAGTPEPYAEPTALIGRGVFRFSRNPLYLGMTTVLFGESAVCRSIPLLLYALFWHHQFVRRVRREERSMLSRFGDDYLRYCESTPRWLPGRRGSPVSAPEAVPAASDGPDSQQRRASQRRRPKEPGRMHRNKLLRIGLILTLLAVVGYLNAYVGLFSPSGTPFLWFDAAGNLFHLVPGLTLVAVASIPRLGAALTSAYRPLLVAVGLALLVAAVVGFSLADRSPPNALGVTNFENPVENVIHWLLGMQCLFAATRQYLASPGESTNARWPA